jgi:hypothetical protein
MNAPWRPRSPERACCPGRPPRCASVERMLRVGWTAAGGMSPVGLSCLLTQGDGCSRPPTLTTPPRRIGARRPLAPVHPQPLHGLQERRQRTLPPGARFGISPPLWIAQIPESGGSSQALQPPQNPECLQRLRSSWPRARADRPRCEALSAVLEGSRDTLGTQGIRPPLLRTPRPGHNSSYGNHRGKPCGPSASSVFGGGPSTRYHGW